MPEPRGFEDRVPVAVIGQPYAELRAFDRHLSDTEIVPALEPFIVDTFREFGRDDGREPGFVLYHGAVNNEEDGPVEVCVPTDEGDKRLPAGEIAFTEISGEQCQFPEILGKTEPEFEHDFFAWTDKQVASWGYDEETTRKYNELQAKGEKLDAIPVEVAGVLADEGRVGHANDSTVRPYRGRRG